MGLVIKNTHRGTRDRERETDRQTDRVRERDRERQAGGQTDRVKETDGGTPTDRQRWGGGGIASEREGLRSDWRDMDRERDGEGGRVRADIQHSYTCTHTRAQNLFLP